MKLSRRNFLKSSLAVSATSLSPLSIKLANAATSNHKALVGIFLYGGNDAFNMVVPQSGTQYTDYVNARPNIALDNASLVHTGLSCTEDVPLGLHPAMSALEPIFANDNANIIVNSGHLVEPTVGNVSAKLPDFLMAHNHQQTMWQSGTNNMDARFGWAGRLLDMAGNYSGLSSAISISGEQKWLRSSKQKQLQIPSSGPSNYNGGADRLESMLAQGDYAYNNLYQDYYAGTIKPKYVENADLIDILEGPSAPVSNVTYPDNGLATQLEVAAKMIKSQASLGQQRQVIMVGIGGFDTHKNQADSHAGLLGMLASALAAFQQDLELSHLSEQVTTFTMSDFGRRIMSNETGTDHGWAGHQLVVGGAVKGTISNNGKAIGNWPDLKPGSKNDYKNGRIIPEVAADQINATLANWFLDGASTTQLTELFPTLVNFKGNETLTFL